MGNTCRNASTPGIGPIRPAEPIAGDRPTRTATLEKLRLAARSAHDEVVGAGPGALRVALAVYEAQIDASERRLASQREVFKLMAKYASEPWPRTLAQAALASPEVDLGPFMPATLYDPDLVTADAADSPRRVP